MTHTFSFNDAASPSSSREVSPTTTTPPPADFVGEVKKQGFVEKASKLFGTWKPRYLRLSDRTVSYSDNEDTRAKGTMMIERVERTAETVAQFNTPRDMYSLILFGGSKERWVVRCQNERDFFEWYSALRCALATARLAAPVIDGLVDHRVGLPLARVPLTHLCNFGALDEAAIYCFVPVLPFPPIAEKKVKGGMRSGAVFMDDRCLFQCSGDGSVLKCVELRNVECVMHAPCRSGGLLVGVKCARPHPDFAFIVFDNASLRVFVDTVKKVVDALRDDGVPALRVEPSIQTVLESSLVTPIPTGFEVRVIIPRTKQSLAEHLQKHDICCQKAEARRNSYDSPDGSPTGTPSTTPRQSSAINSIAASANVDPAPQKQPGMLVAPCAALTISSLLESIGLQQYERTLRRRGVDIDVLQLATPIDLLRWGVVHSSHRQQILDAVRTVGSFALSSPPMGPASGSTNDSFSVSQNPLCEAGNLSFALSGPSSKPVLAYSRMRGQSLLLHEEVDRYLQQNGGKPSAEGEFEL